MSANISLDHILIGQTASTWEEAIRTAATPLVDSHSITPEYVRQMIQSVETYGPYIVLMPGFALAHASPGSDVLHSDISIATFQPPVDFHSENGPVSVVMCLACTDRTSHIDRLQSIASTLMDADSIRRIAACKNKEELYSLFQE
ncbi:PTS sugar transporter subunit IIA [Pseudoflavonifractor sp. An85]|uniref:PTS sugar transporter subunit IIA n=1 Tax=Pseudoflavonifractor sp. An85 TaxID=1965661 RepID=UPI000B39ECE6|nr:PTS sugar transporter subunit IIA [Pseudoflavonifractor sp. An85]OUN24634.1 hypothetical protein B5G37_06610 [Pseudoflavonifractor sp. An85]